MARYIFKEGEAIAHIGNIDQRMWIVEIRKKPKINDKGKEIGKILIGIFCHWWNGNVLEREMFHSRELIPWVVAEKGQEEVNKFIHSSEYSIAELS